MELSKSKEIERLANNAKNLKDFGTDGLDKNGAVKKGYHRLKDGRIIRRADLYPVQIQEIEDIEALKKEAVNFPNLFDCKNISINKTTGKMKNGYLALDSGKVISIAKLKEAIALVNIDVQDPETVK